MPRDIFLSHSSGDADVGRELRSVLEDAGYTCWMAPDDVDGTDPWAEQILGAIENSRAMIVLISTNANRSPHVSREVNLALGRRRAVLPIRIENVAPEASLEYLLSLVQRVDAFPPPIVDHRDRILRRLRAIVPLSAPGPAAVPPGEPETTLGPLPAPSLGTSAATGEPDLPTEPVQVAAVHGSQATAAPLEPAAQQVDPGAGSLPAGTRVGAFTIEGVLGQGGMATVYRAIQEEPHRRVALKVVRADHAADPVYRQRFLAEKDTLAALEHQSIVPIYAAGDAGGVLYIAMRLIDGPDLARRIADAGRFSLAETIATLRPIADSVDYAHEVGIVHRDLKPSNIILDRHGRPYLTDFGLGKQLDKSHGLSAPGIALGTLAYMAPEQFTGLTDPGLADRVDVYALACVAYECLTGSPPFNGATPERLMYAHLHEPLPERPDLSDAVEDVLRRALAKNPADRYPTANSFIAALAGAEAASTRRTAAIVVPPTVHGGRGGLSAWARANRMLAGAGATLAGLVVVATIALAVGDPSSSGSPGPGRTQTAVDPTLVATQPGPSVPPTATDVPATPATPTDTPPTDRPPTDTPPTDTPPTDRPPPPTPTPDNRAPTNVSVKITKNTVYTPNVNLDLGASGASQMRLGTAGSASGSCSYGDWIGFRQNYNDFSINGGTAGQKWVCAEFRDAADNRASDRDSVYFDHRPKATNGTFDLRANDSDRLYWCSVLKANGYLIFPVLPTLADDQDAGDSVVLTRIWRGSIELEPADNGRDVWIYYTPKSNFSYTEETWNFEVVDEHGGTDTASFTVKLGACPA